MTTILNDIATRAAEIAGPNATATRQLEIQHTLHNARKHGQLIIYYSNLLRPLYHYEFASLMKLIDYLDNSQ